MNSKIENIQAANGKLAILTPGMGAVTSTLIAGVLATKKGLNKPIGSLTQMGKIRLGKRSDNRSKLIKDLVPLANLEDIVFGGWDIFHDNAYEAAIKAKVVDRFLLEQVRVEMENIQPMSGVFDERYIKNLKGENVKKFKTKMEASELLIKDIRNFLKTNNCSRAVIVWCASTEAYNPIQNVHLNLKAFEEGLRNNDPAISPSQIYAYAAIKERVPYVNGSPNISVEIPALQELAMEMAVAISGSDFKTGQTLMKTIIAPGLKNRLLGVEGWFSTNILGNRDGLVLDDPESFRSKEVSKGGVLEDILSKEEYPDLYGNLFHKIRIEYYPPRGDNKEGWDNIDIVGWLGEKMQIKIDFLCKDSILAAPIVLDLALFVDLAQRAGMRGIQEWLGFYLKAPLTKPGIKAVNDLSLQLLKLENTLRFFAKEELINHLGLTHYGVDEE
ncbi:MAG: inositol-3-phosphate synthase [Bacteriovorax sp.]|nr:inositol-3-phosphate synthase [Bacteriovorax sp.]